MNLKPLGHFVILAAMGCAPDASPSSSSESLRVTVDTVDGVPFVLNEGDPLVWDTELVLSLGSIGSVGEPSPDEFFRITSAILSPDRELFVANSGSSEIRVFDLEGSLVRTIGREGQGPGEFRSLYSLSFVGNTLLALDFGNARVGMLETNGSWLGQRAHAGRISGSPAILRLYQVGRDETYAWSVQVEDGEVARTFIQHTETTVGAVIPQRMAPEMPGTTVVCRTSDGSVHFFSSPFAPRFIQHPHRAGRIAIASTDQYRVALVGPDGDTTQVFERKHPRVPVTDAEWESGTQEYRDFREERGDAKCEPQSLSRPEFKPFIADLFVDVEGRFWIEVNEANGTQWEIFSPDGRLLGAVEAYPRTDQSAPFMVDEFMVLVSTDSLGVEGVQIYRMNVN